MLSTLFLTVFFFALIAVSLYAVHSMIYNSCEHVKCRTPATLRQNAGIIDVTTRIVGLKRAGRAIRTTVVFEDDFVYISHSSHRSGNLSGTRTALILDEGVMEGILLSAMEAHGEAIIRNRTVIPSLSLTDEQIRAEYTKSALDVALIPFIKKKQREEIEAKDAKKNGKIQTLRDEQDFYKHFMELGPRNSQVQIQANTAKMSPTRFMAYCQERIETLEQEIENILNAPDDADSKPDESKSQGPADSAIFDIRRGRLVRYRGSNPVVILPESVTEIGPGAFYREPMIDVTIHSGVTKFEYEAFHLCHFIRIRAEEGSVAHAYALQNNIEFIPLNKKLSDTVRAESVAEAAVLLQATVKEGICGANIRWELCADGTLVITGTGPIPDYEQGKSPFGKQEVHTLIISEGITDVGDHAFFGLKNLTSVNLPSTLSRIGQSAFAFCKALPRVEIPKSVTEIGPCAFDNCLSLRRALIHPVIPKIGMWAFAGCPKLKLFVHETGTALLYAMQNNLKVANIDLPEPPEEEECTEFEEVLIGENDDVVYDENAKTLEFVIGNVKSVVPVGQVEKIQMCTSDGGPFVDDMWTEIYVPGHMYKLMSGNPKSQPIIFDILSHAFPMDLEKIVEASTCTMNRTFLLYEREKVSDAKDVHHDEQEEVSDVKDVQLCAQDGDAEEQVQLGMRLYSGDGVPRDLKAAAECFRRASELGNADGQHNLGYCYEQGIGLSKDLASAAFWYQKAAEQGKVESQFNLGVAYNTGRGVAMDKAMAAKWMEKAAEQGLALAQFNIGTYYENGNGVDVDWNKAFYWYQKASDQNLAMAQTNLALCYLKGNGTEENLEKAVEWMEKAAAGGDENAQGQLPMLKILLNIKEKRKDSEGNV